MKLDKKILVEAIRAVYRNETYDEGILKVLEELKLKDYLNESRIFYKVVSLHGNTKTTLHYKSYSVIYKLGRWTYPKITGSKLFVFDSLMNAIKHCGKDAYRRIYECHIKKPIFNINYLDEGLEYDTEKFYNFWKKNLMDNRDCGFRLPTGTVLVDAVKLIQPVN